MLPYRVRQTVKSSGWVRDFRGRNVGSNGCAHPRIIAIGVSLVVAIASESAAQARGQSEGSTNPPLSSFVSLGTPLLSIGSANQEGPTTFGSITGVTTDGSGNVYVLDHTTHSVRVFSSGGRFLGSAGRAGRGPGDLSWPHTLFHDRKNRLFVIDRVNGVVIFETRNGILTFRRSLATNVRPNNACLLGDNLIIAAWRDQKVLQVFDTDGRPIRSFGEGFSRDTSEAVREVANQQMQVQLTCDDAGHRIFLAPIALGEVRAYDDAGQLVWQRRLDGFEGHKYVRSQRGVVTRWGKHYTSSLLRLGDSLLLVQVKHREPVKGSYSKTNPGGMRGYWETRGIITYVLSARSGVVLSRSTGAPLIGAITPGFAVAYEDDPIPRVTFLPWREMRR